MSRAEENANCPHCNSSSVRMLSSSISISGTRDSFGVRNSFIDEKSGDVIDTWGKWEKHGYRKVDKKDLKNDHAREAFERKTEELKGQRLKQLSPEEMPI